MLLFPFQCQTCGWIQDEIVSRHDELPDMKCEMRCSSPKWKKHHEIEFQVSARVGSDLRFPHLTQMSETYIDPSGNVGRRRIVAKSRSHMEQLMEKHGYVYYEESASTQPTPQMPEELQEWGNHPAILRYKDKVAQGKIPNQMVLSEDELKERFHV